MSEAGKISTRDTKQSAGYSPLAKAIHWTVALCVLALIPAGLTMTNIKEGPLQDSLFSYHESFGLVVLMLMMLRIVLKLAGRMPAPSEVLTPFERTASLAAHGLLYLLVFLTPLLGWLGVNAYGGEGDFFGLAPPRLIGKDEALAKLIFTAHLAAALAVALVVILHVAGAIVHARRGDGILQRMWPGR